MAQRVGEGLGCEDAVMVHQAEIQEMFSLVARPFCELRLVAIQCT